MTISPDHDYVVIPGSVVLRHGSKGPLPERSGYIANHPDHGLPRAKAPEHEYYVRVISGKPVAPERHDKKGRVKVMFGGIMTTGKLVWIDNRLDGEKLQEAIAYFKAESKRTIETLTDTAKSDIKHARKKGASIPLIMSAYNITKGTVKDVLRGK